MVRAHRQAWCWQDEWYGLSMENIRELEREAQLMLSRKMAQFSEDEGATELAKDQDTQDQASGVPPEPSSSHGEPLVGRGLKKQWSTSSKSSRSSKRGGEPQRRLAMWCPCLPCPPGSLCHCWVAGPSSSENGLFLMDIVKLSLLVTAFSDWHQARPSCSEARSPHPSRPHLSTCTAQGETAPPEEQDWRLPDTCRRLHLPREPTRPRRRVKWSFPSQAPAPRT